MRIASMLLGCVSPVLIAAAPATNSATNPATNPATKPTSRPGGEIVAPAKRDVPGTRINLQTGTLFIPDFFKPSEAGPDLLLWFPGGWVVEQEFYTARLNAVCFTPRIDTMARGFAEEKRFDDLLKEVSDSLATAQITDKPIRRIAIGSFSGKYTIVNAILKLPSYRERITDVVLADSLYPPPNATKFEELDAPLAPILDFARRAADGKCTFIFSQLYPPEEKYRGNGTTIAAMWLIDRVGATKVDEESKLGNRTQLYHADKNGFHVMGIAGMMNQDHFDHLYNMHELLVRTSIGNTPEDKK